MTKGRQSDKNHTTFLYPKDYYWCFWSLGLTDELCSTPQHPLLLGNALSEETLSLSLNRSSGSCLLRFYQLHWQHFCIISSFFLFVLSLSGTRFAPIPSRLFPTPTPCLLLRAAAAGVRLPTSVHKEPNLNPLFHDSGSSFNPPLNHDTDHFICLTRFLLNSFKCLYLVILIVLAFLFVWLCSDLAITIFFFQFTACSGTKKKVAECQVFWNYLEVNGPLKYSTCNIDLQDRCAFKTKYIHKWSQ